MDQAKKLLSLIESSRKILITAHISPDPDAIASVSLLSEILKLNYPAKVVKAVMEEKPDGLEFIQGYDNLAFGSIASSLKDFTPDLFILLDGNNYERCSRHDGQRVRDCIREKSVKTIVIDHHEPAGKDNVDLYINRDSPATAQDIYEIFIDELKLQSPTLAAQTAMVGFYADTGGFVYVKAGKQDKLFGFAKRLVDGGADIELVKYSLENYSQEDLKVIGQLCANLSHENNYNFSYLSDEYINDWIGSGRSQSQLQRPTNTFLNNYIRNINGRHWGFIVYKNTLQGEGFYSASFRS
ncbi:MAG TPA: DHH family phosphoesterase, partial [Candidatus Saccharimonadales bacterium]|nr:DHH family phosphoesterase [Candidatus Saccharimonadales bacterium]